VSYNGSGVWTANSTGLPVVTGTTISSTMFNAFTADVATGLSTAVCKDGQQTCTQRVPFADGISTFGVNLDGSAGSGQVGFQQSGSSLALTSQKKMRQIVYLDDFADNTTPGTTDMSAAFDDAVAALPSTGGTIRYKGINLLSAAKTVAKRIKFEADGGFGETAGSLPTSYFLKDAALTTALIDVTQKGVIFEGGGVVGALGNTGDGISINAGRVVLRDFGAFSMGQDGIRIGKDATGGNANAFDLAHIMTKGNGRHGVYVHSNGYNANAGILVSLDSQSNTGDGIRVGQCALNTFINILSDINANGIYCTAESSANHFIGGDMEAHSGNDIFIAVPTTGGSNTFTNVRYNPAAVNDGDPLTTWLDWTRFKTSTALQLPWTPVDNSGAGLVFATAEGTYVENGGVIHIFGSVTYPVTANGANASIGGLPIGVNAANRNGGVLTWSTVAAVQKILPGGTSLDLASSVGGGVSNANASGGFFRFMATYYR
jgi:hypothetical protein